MNEASSPISRNHSGSANTTKSSSGCNNNTNHHHHKPANNNANPRMSRRSRKNNTNIYSVLDREVLLGALEKENIHLKKDQLDGFYQSLHRFRYPSLSAFCDIYYKNETESTQKNTQKGANNNNATPVVFSNQKNAVSQRKNKNRKQLPKAFLNFLAKHDADNADVAAPNNNNNNDNASNNNNDDNNNAVATTTTTTRFVTLTSQIHDVQTSSDGSTTKFITKLYDGKLVESVIMRYMTAKNNHSGAKNADDNTKNDQNNNNNTASKNNKRLTPGRATLCVSSQCGCAMGCTFCATGTMGLSGNLNYTEILEQLIHADSLLCVVPANGSDGGSNGDDNNNFGFVRNIVFMGMGEPLDNLPNVVSAVNGMVDRKRWNIGYGKITVSTVGIPSKIKKLTQQLPQVSLALSLHAPLQHLREAIVPTAKHYKLNDIIDALDQHMTTMSTTAAAGNRNNNNNNNRNRHNNKNKNNGSSNNNTKNNNNNNNNKEQSRNRKAMIEYIMLDGPTTTLECAHELGKLCRDRRIHVNLIPYNKTDVKDPLSCPSTEHILEFQSILLSEPYRVFTTIRRTMGADIVGACGQLLVKKEQEARVAIEEEKKEEDNVPDIEDIILQQQQRQQEPSKQQSILPRKQQQPEPISSSRSRDSETHSTNTTRTKLLETKEESFSTKARTKETPTVATPQEKTLGVKNDYEKWIRPLAVATTLSASCFVVTGVLYVLGSNKQTRTKK